MRFLELDCPRAILSLFFCLHLSTFYQLFSSTSMTAMYSGIQFLGPGLPRPKQVVLSTFHRLPRRKIFPIVAMLVSVLATHSTTLRSSLVHIPSSRRPQKRLNISQRSPGVVEYHVLHTAFLLFSVCHWKEISMTSTWLQMAQAGTDMAPTATPSTFSTFHGQWPAVRRKPLNHMNHYDLVS